MNVYILLECQQELMFTFIIYVCNIYACICKSITDSTMEK